MTLFTKQNCELCERIKQEFDLMAMKINIEVLDKQNAGALAHLAWHGLVDTARKKLPILVLDDSSTLSDYSDIVSYLANQADGAVIGRSSDHACADGRCAL